MKPSTTKKVQYFMIIVFIMVTIFACFIMFKLAYQSKSNWVQHKMTNSTIVEIYGGYKGKPNYQIMKLADSQTFTIPNEMLYKIKVGDSVQKQKDSNFYIFTFTHSKVKVKTGWQ
jgi:hypothetical protein